MKYQICIIFLATTMITCRYQKSETQKENHNRDTIILGQNEKNEVSMGSLTEKEIDDLTTELDRLIDDKILIQYYYPGMSGCGGGVYGYYQDTTLHVIDSYYRAELGYSQRKMYWKKNKIIKIIYTEHFAEWEKYEKQFPAEKFKFDPQKMTYTDTDYQITLGGQYQMKKLVGSKIISNKLDSVLIKELMNCGFEMRNELETEKIAGDNK